MLVPGTSYKVYLENSNCWNVLTFTGTKFPNRNQSIYASDEWRSIMRTDTILASTQLFTSTISFTKVTSPLSRLA